MRISTLVGSLAAVVALALPAAAVEPPVVIPAAHEELSRTLDDLAREIHGLGERWRGHFGRSAAAGERPLITLMLNYRQELGLSPAQVEALERLRSDFQREAIKRDAEIRVAEMDLAALLRTDPADVGRAADLGKIEAKVRDIERLRAEQRLARLRTIEQGKAQLTAEQRTKLGALLAEARPLWPPTGPPAAMPQRF